MFVLFSFPAHAQKLSENEKKAVEVFRQLDSIPDQKVATSPQQNEWLKLRRARQIIEQFARDFKRNRSDSISFEDMRAALLELNRNAHLWADQKYGNKDGKGDVEEFQKFQKASRSKLGYQMLLVMMREFNL